MRFQFKNLGVIKQAELELGDFTIICGKNNTGKSYVTHAIAAYLEFLRANAEFVLPDEKVVELLEKGATEISEEEFGAIFDDMLRRSSEEFSSGIHKIFAGKEELFVGSLVEMVFEKELNKPPRFLFSGTLDIGFNFSFDFQKFPRISIHFEVGSKYDGEIPNEKEFQKGMNSVTRILFEKNDNLPKPFLTSAERTGATIFQKELDFTKDRVLEVLKDVGVNKVNPMLFLSEFTADYPYAIRKNVDFNRAWTTLINKDSFIRKEHPEILEQFADIIGGQLMVDKSLGLFFVPQGTEVSLSLMESSSAVRSLTDVGLYLRYLAQKGDIFIIDEPELNLHPENQRKVARLFAQLVNIGLKVFITTHSDYIIKELNTLIMLGEGGKKYLKIAEEEGYSSEEFMRCEQFRVYIAQEKELQIEGEEKTVTGHTLARADIDEMGIDATSFDQAIDDMNRIQGRIAWGEF